jgi:hypothetical protein
VVFCLFFEVKSFESHGAANKQKSLIGSSSGVFSYGDHFVPYVFKAKNLGVTFSNNPNWGDHAAQSAIKSTEP